MTINNNTGLFEPCNWNEYNLNLLTSINWSAILVPAAAVIPAPIAYIKVVASEKLVAGLLSTGVRFAARCTLPLGLILSKTGCALHWVHHGLGTFTLKKIRVFKAGVRLNTSAWNNGIGLWSYFVGFETEVMINRDSWGH